MVLTTTTRSLWSSVEARASTCGMLRGSSTLTSSAPTPPSTMYDFCCPHFCLRFWCPPCIRSYGVLSLRAMLLRHAVVVARGTAILGCSRLWRTRYLFGAARRLVFLALHVLSTHTGCHWGPTTQQASKIALTSRAFHNEVFGSYAKMVNTVFGYDKVRLGRRSASIPSVGSQSTVPDICCVFVWCAVRCYQ